MVYDVMYLNIDIEMRKVRMTRADLAKRLNVTTEVVKNWLTGRTEIPASKIVALADLFHVTTDYLLGRATNAKTSN